MQTSKLKTLQVELTKLAMDVEDKWKLSNFDLKSFPAICTESLKNLSVGFVPDIKTLVAEISELELPPQNFLNGEFSDFPITLVRTDKLLVDMYYWFKSDTSIHNHHFCGAFKVITGQSYQVSYEFKKTHSISEGLDEGTMKQIGNEHLGLGAVHPIDPYDEFIHHIFHIGKPTITLCIRTPVLTGEGLATFVYPKYRVVLSPLKLNQSKWLQALRLNLELDPDTKVEVPWSDGEIAHILLRSANRHSVLTPEVASFLMKHLEEKKFLPGLFELLKKQPKFNSKLKKFGILTGPDKGQID